MHLAAFGSAILLPQVSGYLVSPMAHAPIFIAETPVESASDRSHLIIVNRPVERLLGLLLAKQLPLGWFASILDRDGIIMASTISPETIGTKALPAAIEASARAPASSRYLVSPERIPNSASS